MLKIKFKRFDLIGSKILPNILCVVNHNNQFRITKVYSGAISVDFTEQISFKNTQANNFKIEMYHKLQLNDDNIENLQQMKRNSSIALLCQCQEQIQEQNYEKILELKGQQQYCKKGLFHIEIIAKGKCVKRKKQKNKMQNSRQKFIYSSGQQPQTPISKSKQQVYSMKPIIKEQIQQENDYYTEKLQDEQHIVFKNNKFQISNTFNQIKQDNLQIKKTESFYQQASEDLANNKIQGQNHDDFSLSISSKHSTVHKQLQKSMKPKYSSKSYLTLQAKKNFTNYNPAMIKTLQKKYKLDYNFFEYMNNMKKQNEIPASETTQLGEDSDISSSDASQYRYFRNSRQFQQEGGKRAIYKFKKRNRTTQKKIKFITQFSCYQQNVQRDISETSSNHLGNKSSLSKIVKQSQSQQFELLKVSRKISPILNRQKREYIISQIIAKVDYLKNINLLKDIWIEILVDNKNQIKLKNTSVQKSYIKWENISINLKKFNQLKMNIKYYLESQQKSEIQFGVAYLYFSEDIQIQPTQNISIIYKNIVAGQLTLTIQNKDKINNSQLNELKIQLKNIQIRQQELKSIEEQINVEQKFSMQEKQKKQKIKQLKLEIEQNKVNQELTINSKIDQQQKLPINQVKKIEQIQINNQKQSQNQIQQKKNRSLPRPYLKKSLKYVHLKHNNNTSSQQQSLSPSSPYPGKKIFQVQELILNTIVYKKSDKLSPKNLTFIKIICKDIILQTESIKENQILFTKRIIKFTNPLSLNQHLVIEFYVYEKFQNIHALIGKSIIGPTSILQLKKQTVVHLDLIQNKRITGELLINYEFVNFDEKNSTHQIRNRQLTHQQYVSDKKIESRKNNVSQNSTKEIKKRQNKRFSTYSYQGGQNIKFPKAERFKQGKDSVFNLPIILPRDKSIDF